MNSFRFLGHLIRQTPWQMFAAMAAAPALIAGLALTFYPDVYSLSRSYKVLAQSGVPAPFLGVLGGVCAAWVFGFLAHRLLSWGLYGVMLFHVTLAGSSLLSVGFSAGTFIYLLFAGCAVWAFLNSGGLAPPRGE